jgi:hypothetical protein
MNAMHEATMAGTVPAWLLELASYAGNVDPVAGGADRDLDPQRGWHQLNRNACEFLETLPDGQKMHLRGEDVLSEPASTLRSIAEWLGIRADADAVDEMQHPERSPFAVLGPPTARYGNAPAFLMNPAVPPGGMPQQTLEGTLPWRRGAMEFSDEVKNLAHELGYT